MSVILPGGKKIASRKRCTHCKRVRSLEKFCRSSAGYYSSYCKECHVRKQARWVKKNPRKLAKTFRRYYAKLKRLGVKRICDLKAKKKKKGVITRPNPNNAQATGARRNCNDAR